jgi:nicotinate-nucleotide adenylyltransferase
MKKGKKVGFFGGTFDPIHFGHLNLAIQLMETQHLDEVLFCPAALSPLKTDQPPEAMKLHRKNMVSLAIEPIAGFKLIAHELEKETPSYTIDTLRYLMQLQKDVTEWHLILGEDTLIHFSLWKEPETLISLAPPLIGSRTGESVSLNALPPFLKEILKKRMVKIPLMDVSSTDLRERLQHNRYCGHLLPAKVLDYIHQNQLYSKLKLI